MFRSGPITIVVFTIFTFYVSFLCIHHKLDFVKKTSGDKILQPERNLATSSDVEFPDPRMALDLSELTVKILDIKTGSNPEDFIPSKYKIHLWFVAEYSTEVLILTTTNQQNANDDIIVMFRGSQSLEDYMASANVIMDDATDFVGAPDGVKIHKGYLNCLFTEDIPQQIEDTVLALLGNSSLKLNSEVIFSGHSLGGTLSHMMAIKMASVYRDSKFKVINFGAPRFGNQALKDWVRSDLTNLSAWRFVYKKDFAPRIIPKALGYRHSGNLYQIERTGSAVYYDQTGGGDFAGAPNSWYRGMSFLQHLSYYSTIKANVNNTKYWSRDFQRCKLWMVQCWFK